MVFNKVEPVTKMNQYNSLAGIQSAVQLPVSSVSLSKAQVLLEPNQTQVLAPGC